LGIAIAEIDPRVPSARGARIFPVIAAGTSAHYSFKWGGDNGVTGLSAVLKNSLVSSSIKHPKLVGNEVVMASLSLSSW